MLSTKPQDAAHGPLANVAVGRYSHTAERVLGPAIDGVEGIYDRHRYTEEKAQALKMLAGLIDSILRNDDADKKVRRLRG
jgi:hypothetical protein